MPTFLMCKKLRLMLYLLVLMLAPLFTPAYAAENNMAADPAVQMKVVIEDVLKQLKAHEALYQTNPEQLRTLVAKAALPNFAVERMDQLALAKHWRGATLEQRNIYVREFQRYLIRSYTTTMYLYRNTSLEILGSQGEGVHKAALKVRVKNDRGEAVILLLCLEMQDKWKIIDVNVLEDPSYKVMSDL